MQYFYHVYKDIVLN